MKNLVLLTVQYTIDKTRPELINLRHVFRVIDSPGGKGSTLYFGVNGPEMKITETISELQQKIAIAG
jgi:hypothetical protein